MRLKNKPKPSDKALRFYNAMTKQDWNRIFDKEEALAKSIGVEYDRPVQKKVEHVGLRILN